MYVFIISLNKLITAAHIINWGLGANNPSTH
jgi:hypothetical protein